VKVTQKENLKAPSIDEIKRLKFYRKQVLEYKRKVNPYEKDLLIKFYNELKERDPLYGLVEIKKDEVKEPISTQEKKKYNQILKTVEDPLYQ